MKYIKVAFIVFMLQMNACSVFMAAKQPGKKDVSLFRVGTPRGMLLAEFGLPLVAEERNGRKFEIYKFVDGYSPGAKAGRAVLHGTADILTFGIWEVVGTPTEGVFNGNENTFRVRYDKDDRIDEVVALKK